MDKRIPWKYQLWHFQVFWWKFAEFLMSFSKPKTFFLQIFHYSSVSWDITPLYLFIWSFIYFQQKQPIKVQIRWNFTWAIENLKLCTFTGYFCKNHIKFMPKTSTEELCLMRLKSDAKFKGKLTCDIKYDMRNFVNFLTTTQKSKNCTSMG